MTPRQITLLRSSFAQLEPTAAEAAGQFYARLFALDPTLRSMFPPQLQAQGAKLMNMLAVAIGLLEDRPMLEAALARLGQRHAGYGVQARHYALVGQALIQTLSERLGPAFTPETQIAWATMYGLVAQRMQQAAADLPALRAEPVVS